MAVRLFSIRQATIPGDWDRVIAWVRAVESAGARSPGATCLPKALALHWLLSRQGCRSEIRVGVRHDQSLAAHAWVEHEGQVILGGTVDSFAPMASIRQGQVAP